MGHFVVKGVFSDRINLVLRVKKRKEAKSFQNNKKRTKGSKTAQQTKGF